MRGAQPTALPPRVERAIRGLLLRLLSVFVAFGVGASLTWLYRVEVFGYLLAPAGGQLGVDGRPIFTGPTEMFSLTIKVAVWGGVLTALPVLAYHVYRLARPLLDRQQRRLVVVFLGLIFLFYVAGTAFAYYVLLPTSLGFLLLFGAGIATPMISITEYTDLALVMLFWLGAVFEIPVVMLLLAKLRLVSHERFKRLRWYVPVAAFFFSGIITATGDPVNQALVAVPIIALFEVGLRLAWLARPRARA